MPDQSCGAGSATARTYRCLPLETGGVELAVAAAENFRKLRDQGRTVRKTIDCLIATFCLREGHFLLHRDRGFDPFEQILGSLWVGCARFCAKKRGILFNTS